MIKNNKLDNVWFIGGGTQTFVFKILDRNNDPLDLSNSKIKWALSHMGENELPIVTKDNQLNGGVEICDEIGVFKVIIDAKDTQFLDSAKYEQEMVIEQPNGKILRPSYGHVEIRKGVEI